MVVGRMLRRGKNAELILLRAVLLFAFAGCSSPREFAVEDWFTAIAPSEKIWHAAGHHGGPSRQHAAATYMKHRCRTGTSTMCPTRPLRICPLSDSSRQGVAVDHTPSCNP